MVIDLAVPKPISLIDHTALVPSLHTCVELEPSSDSDLLDWEPFKQLVNLLIRHFLA